jgi:hypothetical protein
MDYKTILIVILSIALVIVVVLAVYFIYSSVVTQSTYVNPKFCTTNSSEFGVASGTAGNVILNLCGTGGNSTCTFSNVANLTEAIALCNQNANICSMFSYAPGIINNGNGPPEGIVNIISPTGGVSASTTYDTYTQQILSTLTSNTTSG